MLLTSNRPPDREEQYCLSFMNEYCNVIGGAITRILQESGSDCKISLPEQFEMREENEPKDTPFTHRETAWWQIKVEKESFVVRLVLDYAEGFNFNKVEEIEEPDNILEFF